MANIAPAWPWSVPPLPFCLAMRPNSDMVRITTSSMLSPRSVTSAAMDCPKSSSRCASCPVAPPWFTCVSQPPTSAKATSSPTFAFTSCAMDLRRWPNCDAGYTAPLRASYCWGFAARSIFTASNISVPVPWIRSADPVRYSASSCSACVPPLRTVNSATEFMATTGALPCSTRGVCGVMATARNGVTLHCSQVPEAAR